MRSWGVCERRGGSWGPTVSNLTIRLLGKGGWPAKENEKEVGRKQAMEMLGLPRGTQRRSEWPTVPLTGHRECRWGSRAAVGRRWYSFIPIRWNFSVNDTQLTSLCYIKVGGGIYLLMQPYMLKWWVNSSTAESWVRLLPSAWASLWVFVHYRPFHDSQDSCLQLETLTVRLTATAKRVVFPFHVYFHRKVL